MISLSTVASFRFLWQIFLRGHIGATVPLLAGGSRAEENGIDVGIFDFTIVNIGITETWNIGSVLFLFYISFAYYMNRNKEDKNRSIQ